MSWLLARLAAVGLALAFVALGAEGLDLGPRDARLGLAAGERPGPLGQVFGYWAPDLWPAQVLPSMLLARFEALGRPTVGSVRWPAALAGTFAGLILAAGLGRVLGARAHVLAALCWFGSLALIDRSAGAGIDLIVGLSLVGAIERLLRRGADIVAGLWASLAFLAGGWPPVLLIVLAVVVLGHTTARLSFRLLLPPLATALAWSAWTIWSSSAELMSAALALPLTQKPSWLLAAGVIALGLPWSPMALLASSESVRAVWHERSRAHVLGWLQVAVACLVAGSFVPGLAQSARVTAIAGLAVLAAACLESVCAGRLAGVARGTFIATFSTLLTAWVGAVVYGTFIWCVAIPYYRPLGVATGLSVLAVMLLAGSVVTRANCRRALVCMVVMAAVLKLAHWAYYAPEWNYRRGQGPAARAIAQWIPRGWTLYTTIDWPADLVFPIRRPVRQLHSAEFLRCQPGANSKFLLLQPLEFENWPASAPAVSLVARFEDPSGRARILARTAGPLPPPFGPNLLRLGYAAKGYRLTDDPAARK
jgi:hypothetical protein